VADVAKAQAARERQLQLMDLCDECGAYYLTREENSKAKAGNLNASLPHIHGDLILILDADHVPTQDILKKTVGFFCRDPRLFLVQTPHFFVMPDPIEKNLGLYERMPAENAMFFGAIHPGLDFWGASFFCGSAALISRVALNEAGGFEGDSITEDAETALKLHRFGWNSIYLREPLISGLQPETFTSLVIQRARWAQGMVQILLLHNPLVTSGLLPWQRLCYLSNMLYWLFPFARVIFLLSPVAYIDFDLKIYNASADEVLAYSVPYMLILGFTARFLFGRFRWNLVAAIYENLLSLFSMRAIIAVLRDPASPDFKVTPKSETSERDAISPMAGPFYVVTAILVVTAIVGIWRLWVGYGERDMVLMAMGWLLSNLVVMAINLGALFERRQRRANPRLPVDFDANLDIGGTIYPLKLKDMSIGGCKAVLQLSATGNVKAGEIRKFNDMLNSQVKQNGMLNVSHRSEETSDCGLEATLLRCYLDKGRPTLLLRFQPNELHVYRNLVELIYGDSKRLSAMFMRHETSPGILKEFLFLLGAGLRNGHAHMVHILSLAMGRIHVRMKLYDKARAGSA
jgi:cellulose synthase (UDP-forming)